MNTPVFVECIKMRIICAHGVCTNSDKHALASFTRACFAAVCNPNVKLIHNHYKILPDINKRKYSLRP